MNTMGRREEFHIKTEKIRDFMRRKDYEAVLFKSQANFSWISCGGTDQVIHGKEEGFNRILVLPDKVALVVNNIEKPRLVDEEVEDLDFSIRTYNWLKGSAEEEINGLLKDKKVACDAFSPIQANTAASDTEGQKIIFEPELSSLRVPLLEPEIERFRSLGNLCAEAIDDTMEKLRPGMTEYAIQAETGAALLGRGLFPQVLLVGTDERIFRYRHPIPTEKTLKNYGMIVICAEKWGLILSMTRLFHFGPVPKVIEEKYSAVREVEKAYIAANRPGASIPEILSAGIDRYRSLGFKEEELNHFQGGTCGYAIREHDLEIDCDYRIQEGEVFAHNPSISGVAIEDTIYMKDGKYEALSLSPHWPSEKLELPGCNLDRPQILRLDR